MTDAEDIFQANACSTLRDMGMPHLDPAHGAAVETVRWCLVVRGKPSHLREAFLVDESPALLEYLERLARSGKPAGWRSLEERINQRLELLRETYMHPCARPWLAAIWHVLPELTAIGQAILDRQAEEAALAAKLRLLTADTNGGTGGDGDKGSAGKAGSTGTTAKPSPSRHLVLPSIRVILTDAEREALDLDDRNKDDDPSEKVTPEGIDGTDVPDGSKGPGGKGGPK